jgi:hypothetical protein
VHLAQRSAREKVKTAAFLDHPLNNVPREIATNLLSGSARREQQAVVYASQLQRKKLHEFEPWPDHYSIRHVLRNPKSGILIASECSFSAVMYNQLIGFPQVDIMVATRPFRESRCCLRNRDALLTAVKNLLSGFR